MRKQHGQLINQTWTIIRKQTLEQQEIQNNHELIRYRSPQCKIDRCVATLGNRSLILGYIVHHFVIHGNDYVTDMFEQIPCNIITWYPKNDGLLICTWAKPQAQRQFTADFFYNDLTTNGDK